MNAEDKAAKLKRLVLDGRAKGYVLYDQIDEFLESSHDRGADLDEILTELAKNSIGVANDPAQNDSHPQDSAHIRNEQFLSLLRRLDDSPLRMYVEQIRELPRLSQEEEEKLAGDISLKRANAEDAMKRLVEANLSLVVSTAMTIGDRGHDMIEVLQEGNIGLIKAAERFQPFRPYRFSTYAMWWIRRSILQLTR